ncbi:MAG: branched-chain amino acid ABC transporter permease [Candidatus Thiodiazotropha taylori]|nr:branched-chain amino acid ABC transporter permease [Candidatus Thiodiazotropha taylori]
MEYIAHILVLVEIYVLLSISLNLISGYTGLLSIGHAAFFGIGAYTAALLSLNIQSSFLVTMIATIVLSGIVGAVVSLPALRIRDDYFVIATLAFQAVVFNILNNWVSLTSGPMGLPGIPKPSVFGWVLSSKADYLLALLILCVVVFLFSVRLVKSPFGRVLKAIREDEEFTQCAGKNVLKYKTLVFILGSIVAAVAGVMYAHYITYIDPTTFDIMESIYILTIVIIGGAGSVWGPIVGAVLLVVLPELLRFLGLPTPIAANVQQIIYGLALVLTMMWRPQGLVGDYAFGGEEHRRHNHAG